MILLLAGEALSTHYGHSYAATDEFLGLEPPVAHQVLQAAEIDNSLSLIVSAHDAAYFGPS